MRHSTIAKVLQDGQMTGYIIQIEDQCYLLGICGGFEKDDRPMDEITESLLKEGCNITFLAISVHPLLQQTLTMYEPKPEGTTSIVFPTGAAVVQR